MKFIIVFDCIGEQNKGSTNADIAGFSKNGTFASNKYNRPAYWDSRVKTFFNSNIHNPFRKSEKLQIERQTRMTLSFEIVNT